MCRSSLKRCPMSRRSDDGDPFVHLPDHPRRDLRPCRTCEDTRPGKLSAYHARAFSIFPDLLERFFAVYIPWLELILGLCLLTGLLYRAAALLFALLISGFTVAILSVMARGIEIDCGCFGLLADYLHLPDAADYKAVIRNLVFLAMAHAIFYAKKSRFSLEEHFRSRDTKGVPPA